MSGLTINRVALCGGTHGNERTGVTAVERRLRSATEVAPDLYNPQTFELMPIISNPAAVAVNRRYVEFDLNRCFASRDLAPEGPATVEHARAREIDRLLGPKGAAAPACEFTIDLHTTTSNLGPTVILRETDELAVAVARHILTRVPAVRVLTYRDEPETDWRPHAATGAGTPPAGGGPGDASLVPGDFPYLAEVTPSGIEIEVGPVAQGVVRAATVLQTEAIIDAILEALDMINRGAPVGSGDSLTIYRFIADVDYPRTIDGALDGMVHPARQDRDFEPLSANAPLFLTFSGKTVGWEGPEGLVPVFINEAAYYEKHAAMTICEKDAI